jgi:hypothetical protein
VTSVTKKDPSYDAHGNGHDHDHELVYARLAHIKRAMHGPDWASDCLAYRGICDPPDKSNLSWYLVSCMLSNVK